MEKKLLFVLGICILVILCSNTGRASMEKSTASQFLGKIERKRSLYEECYVEQCNYEEVLEALGNRRDADAYWNRKNGN
ncbi:prothrombin-like isoform X1 [Bombina bombina]|uniref:prothrombin-like isoform X1 n=1 Tax=Bombina bombina TaxID=8345 RepID=UPI00235AC2E2|nr:prothrombin-like isoform X1 [Bombina bombina]XP_053576921.1 prothrombin-like isoform X1 [Bombina bombina]